MSISVQSMKSGVKYQHSLPRLMSEPTASSPFVTFETLLKKVTPVITHYVHSGNFT